MLSHTQVHIYTYMEYVPFMDNDTVLLGIPTNPQISLRTLNIHTLPSCSPVHVAMPVVMLVVVEHVPQPDVVIS